MTPRRDKRRYGRTARDVRRGGLGTQRTPSTVKNINLWLRVNGIDVANSNIIQSITPLVENEAVAFSHILSLQTNDYCELAFSVNDLSTLLKATPIRIFGGQSFGSATPSVTLNMTQIQLRR